jgi:hypothetical protein
MLGAIVALFIATRGGFCEFSSQSASLVFLCVKSKYLPFVYNKDPIKLISHAFSCCMHMHMFVYTSHMLYGHAHVCKFKVDHYRKKTIICPHF